MPTHIPVKLGDILLSLSEIADIANPSLAFHQQRTAYIALSTARSAGTDDKSLEDIFTAALLHDIGALTLEDKITLHNSEAVETDSHCINGQFLLQSIPWFGNVPKIVRHHHTDWSRLNASINEPAVFAAQVIYLADHIERLIERNKYILHQKNDILDNVRKLSSDMFHPDVVKCFIEASMPDSFWLDIMSPGLNSLLMKFGTYKHIEIGMEDVSIISNLYKAIIDYKSPFTATHSSGVSACSEMLSKLCGFSDADILQMKIAGDLHDIGKMTILNSILEKPGKLNQEELEIMRSHTYYTYYILNTVNGMQQIAKWAAYHHEKLDGSGYPFAYTADQLDTGSRIVAVADIFTAVSEDRPYRPGMPKDSVYRLLKGKADSGQLDKKIIEALYDNYNEVYAYVRSKQSQGRTFYNTHIRSQSEVLFGSLIPGATGTF